MPHTREWLEETPPDTQAVALGAQRIREMKEDITERMAVDHVWDDSVDTDGVHSKVTLPELGADPTDIADTGIVYTKDDGGTTTLYYIDDSGTVYQLTGTLTNTTLAWAQLTGVPAFVAFLEGLVDPDEDSFLIWDDSAGDFAFVPRGNAGAVYTGYVDASVAAEDLPAGWSVTNDSAGVYTVTHNLGLAATTDLRITLTTLAGPTFLNNAELLSVTANTFVVSTQNQAGDATASANMNFFFIAVLKAD